MAKSLKEIRKDLGLTQVEIAESLGITHPTYNVYENGKKKFPPHLIKILKDKYNVDYTESISDEVIPSNQIIKEALSLITETVKMLKENNEAIMKDHNLYRSIIEKAHKEGKLKLEGVIKV